jgi:hypothetical protein
VEVGQPSALATAEVPPSLSMMSDAFMGFGITENRKATQELFADCVIYAQSVFGQNRNVFTAAEIFAMLDARGVRNIEVARALDVNPSRITELRKGERLLKLDEAIKLVDLFGLERDQAVAPLPAPILRLLVQYVAMVLGVPQERTQARLAELTEDLRAFAELVADPKVRRSVDAAEGFFRAMVLRRPRNESEAQLESDPAERH